MIISTIIRTFKREQLLARAVGTVLDQKVDGAEIEITVVNDSGEPLGPADWQKDPRVRVFTTHRTKLCFAGNAGAALSRGDYLHFLDDDDMLLPGAYQALLDVAASTSAVWTYGAYELMNEEGKVISTVRPVVRGSFFALAVADARIPLGSALIRRDAYLQAGGIDPTLIPAEDADLLQRISLVGSVEMVDHLVARFRVDPQGATTTPWTMADEAGGRKRERVFAMPCCVRELRRSLAENDNEPSLRGRLARYYWGSALRHLRAGSPLTALSRFGVGVQFFLPGCWSPKFWRGLRGG